MLGIVFLRLHLTDANLKPWVAPLISIFSFFVAYFLSASSVRRSAKDIQ